MAVGTSGRGPIRRTVESLLRAERDAAEMIDEAGRETLEHMARIAARVRDSAATAGPLTGRYRAAAERIDDVARATTPSFATASEQSTAAFTSEVHALLDLLNTAHHPDGGRLPPFDAAAIIRGRRIEDGFPHGFARDYVTTVANELDAGDATSKVGADSHPDPADDVAVTSRHQIVTATSARHRQQTEALMTDPGSHAVELHGPHITAKELELRVGWTRPPNRGIEGADKWRHRSDTDGRIKSTHRVGHEACAFTTPEAFARPLDAFLTVANKHPGGLDGFLNEHFPDGEAPIFMNAEQAGLDPGDTHGYRGAGTGTEEAAGDWIAMRSDAMRPDTDCLGPVRAVAFDPIADGTDPGVRLFFTNRGDGWALTTYYPATGPGPDSTPLEDIR